MVKKYDYVKVKREDIDEIPAKWVPLVRKIIKAYTRFNVWVYKKTNGKFMKNFPGGFPICIIGMKGAKSGLRREVALIHLPEGENIYLVASQGGMDKHPVWYFNIKANPDIDVFYQGETRNMLATQLTEEEKIAAWPHLLSLYPDFDEYQARTDRDIPVFICKPV